ncbi:non-specific lipid transfer protein GPI-anchored 15-like [Rutidosis leptorrhynchoides]|uniref:non-specific lipid transfer protein GPI-anchored 15-like n=1 Tax=Rutidosis leptorrhynchoides TaxID=125765 RepID=UPI003A9963BC
MALKVQKFMGAVLVMMVMVWSGAKAQSITSSCTSALMGLAPCLNFVNGNSSTPSPSCCLSLSSVVQTNPRCLCSLLNGNTPNVGITINQTLAIALPGACSVQTPSISLCNGANGPAGAPASAPTSSESTGSQTSEETPVTEAPTVSSTPSVPSGTKSGSGSKATPSANSGSKYGAPSYLVVVGVLFLGMKL